MANASHTPIPKEALASLSTVALTGLSNLLTERATSVKAYLVEKGIDTGRMDSEGFGITQPKATNDTAAGRAENRRVEFKVKF